MIIGIDYGARNAGTTVIAQLYDFNKVNFYTSTKGSDSDHFILDFISSHADVWLAYIDAPLSLPKIYRNPKKDGDFFFRRADQMTGAMSPMFLGGLTARAMSLAKKMESNGIKVVETYPSKLANVLGFSEKQYKKALSRIPVLCQKLQHESDFEFNLDHVETWHHFDALLCLYSAKRFEMQSAMVFGDESEGTITV